MTSKGKPQRSRLPAAGGFSEPKVAGSGFKGKGRLSGRGGKLPVEAVAQSLGMSKAQLAETAGVSVDTLYRTTRAG